jgi:hypothetical protein
MIYNYYLQSSCGRPMKCPEASTDQYFQTLLEVGAVERRTAEGLLHSGISIHLKYCRFFAEPAAKLDLGLPEQMRVQ